LAQLFTGSFPRALDGKNRLLVPAELRDALSPEDRQGLYLIPGQKCVLLWPRSYLDAYTDRQGADPFGNLAFNRAFYSQMIFRSFDRTGRIVLPGEIAERFRTREVTIVGAGRYLELWSPDDLKSSVTPLDFA
jgi:DNA-binding transcriptional regulator/RsmH inhibitor MraZ